MQRIIGFLFLTLLISSCGPSRFVAPLKHGESAVSASLGGPIVNVPGVATMPLPLTSITYGKGISKNMTVYGSWFSTAAIFGTMQFDLGATYGFWKNENETKGLSVSPGVNFATDIFEWNGKIWPQLDANFYWKYNEHYMVQEDLLTNKRYTTNLLYAGLGSWYELSRKRAHDEPQNTRIIPIVQAGHDLNWGKWTFKTELKIIAPFSSNDNIVVDYKSVLGDYGATGFYLGFTRRF